MELDNAVLCELVKTRWRYEERNRTRAQSQMLHLLQLLWVHFSEERVEGCLNYRCHKENTYVKKPDCLTYCSHLKLVLHEIWLQKSSFVALK